MSDCPHCRDRIEGLEEEVRQLRESAFGHAFIPHAEWRLTGTESALLQLLIARDVVTIESFESAMRARRWDWDASDKLFHVMICKLRKKLGPFGVKINTLWGLGYTLAPEARAAVKAACNGGPAVIADAVDAPRREHLTPAILTYLAEHPEGVTSRMVADHFTGRSSSASAMLAILAERGEIRRWRPEGLKRGLIYYPVADRRRA